MEIMRRLCLEIQRVLYYISVKLCASFENITDYADYADFLLYLCNL